MPSQPSDFTPVRVETGMLDRGIGQFSIAESGGQKMVSSTRHVGSVLYVRCVQLE